MFKCELKHFCAQVLPLEKIWDGGGDEAYFLLRTLPWSLLCSYCKICNSCCAVDWDLAALLSLKPASLLQGWPGWVLQVVSLGDLQVWSGLCIAAPDRPLWERIWSEKLWSGQSVSLWLPDFLTWQIGTLEDQDPLSRWGHLGRSVLSGAGAFGETRYMPNSWCWLLYFGHELMPNQEEVIYENELYLYS